jgi:hypothetical protein
MYKRKGERQSGDKVGGTDLEFVTVALSTEYSYSDEEMPERRSRKFSSTASMSFRPR